jgi:hypothetical protein
LSLDENFEFKNLFLFKKFTVTYYKRELVMRSFMLYLCAIIIVVACYFDGFAQKSESARHFTLNMGCSLPTGDFENTSVTSGGAATPGISGMLEYSQNIFADADIVASVNISNNNVDYSNDVNCSDSYTTTWTMVGLNYSLLSTELGKIYGFGQLGVLYASIPDINYNYANVPPVKVTTNPQMAFAYSLGIGIKKDAFSFSVRYFAGKPNYTRSATTETTTVEFKEKRSVNVFEVLIGFNF